MQTVWSGALLLPTRCSVRTKQVRGVLRSMWRADPPDPWVSGARPWHGVLGVPRLLPYLCSIQLHAVARVVSSQHRYDGKLSFETENGMAAAA
jgi:hypothetical protein